MMVYLFVSNKVISLNVILLQLNQFSSASFTYYSSSVIVSFILSLQNYESSTPFTTSYSKFLHVTGKDVHKPYGIPYSPLLITPIETTLPSVPSYQSLRWSITAFAAEKTELVPFTFKISPPLFWTFGINVFSSHYL
jgi:hypothetical protein